MIVRETLWFRNKNPASGVKRDYPVQVVRRVKITRKG